MSSETEENLRNENVIQQLEEDISTLADHIETLEKQCFDYQTENEQYQQTLNEMEDDMVQLRAKQQTRRASCEQIEELQAQVEKLIEQDHENRQLLDVEVSLNEKLKEETHQLHSSLESKERERQALQDKVQELIEHEPIAVDKAVKKYKRKVIQLLKEKTHLEKINRSLEKQLEPLHVLPPPPPSETNEWKQLCRRKDLKLQLLTQELEKLKHGNNNNNRAVFFSRAVRKGSVVILPEQNVQLNDIQDV